jgi:GH15 family glucan-1,4-alpha-glucosidase
VAAAADEVHADVLANGLDERGVFTQHYDTDALDASCLLMPLLRFLPADDPRVVATVNAIDDELSVDGLVLRYRTDETDDGLQGEEGTFAICSFWLVSALEEIGETRGPGSCARRCSATPRRCSSTQEEIDARSGRHLGNFPQAFTHLALINAVMHVIRADQQLAARQQPLDARRREDPRAEVALPEGMNPTPLEELTPRAGTT